jgi:hypothetical protein
MYIFAIHQVSFSMLILDFTLFKTNQKEKSILLISKDDTENINYLK